jgi:tRNA (adenine22-N1)-methyltransferase
MADVGTDHGQLPVFLVLSGRVPRAVVSDKREAPLQGAKDLAWSCRLSAAQFDARLSDGLAHLASGEAATVTICGMGGTLMARILSENPPSAGVLRLVLQPNNAAEVLRSHLSSHGWAIQREEMIEDGRYFYPVIAASPGEQELSEADALFGPELRRHRPRAFVRWLGLEAHRLEALVARAETAQKRADSASLQRLRQRLGLFLAEQR